MSEPLLSVRNLAVHYPVARKGLLRAVDGIDFDLAPGETLGIVGESGCGKSTLARGILQLVAPTAGSVTLLGKDLTRLDAAELRASRRELQVVFQDPLASLNPRMTVNEIIGEPLRTHFPGMGAEERKRRVAAIMERVGLLPNQLNRYPHEFSGGQCQRIGIARALVLEPKLVICDEPVSALDVSIQAQIVNLLMDLQREMGLALLFIAHDLSVVRHISHRVMVMYLGRVVELADRDTIYASPRHPYTRALIDAVPLPDPRLERAKDGVALAGDLPSPINPPSGCAFRTRCPIAQPRCATERPELRRVADAEVACHFAD